MNIIIGLIAIVIGFLMVWKTEWIVINFGRITWAEEHLGSDGGTRIFYKLLGTIIILIGFGIITGLFQILLFNTLGSLFGGIKG
jgi:hypothetical protein